MDILNVRDFRADMAANFDRVDAGERVLVRRRNRLYAIVPVADEDLAITPSLQAKTANTRFKKDKCMFFELVL